MKSRKREIIVPKYYRAPLWPDDLFDPVHSLWNRHCNIWITAPEWLAWLRRHPHPQRLKVWRHKSLGWTYPSRPMICGLSQLASTLKPRRLP